VKYIYLVKMRLVLGPCWFHGVMGLHIIQKLGGTVHNSEMGGGVVRGCGAHWCFGGCI
jgi:hypothetical protein